MQAAIRALEDADRRRSMITLPVLTVSSQKINRGRPQRIDRNVRYSDHRQTIRERTPVSAVILRAPQAAQRGADIDGSGIRRMESNRVDASRSRGLRFFRGLRWTE